MGERIALSLEVCFAWTQTRNQPESKNTEQTQKEK
jgi:hypothetical protein